MSEANLLDTVEEEKKQYIVVTIGSEQYGLDIAFVDNIVRMQKITRVPKSLPHYRGVINLRGEVVPVMSIRRKMGLEDDVFTKASRIIILKLEEQGNVGIVVDEVKEVVSLGQDDIDQNTRNTNREDANFINGIGKNGDSLISIFDINKVVDESDYI
ncbi:MAG: chemotaxis protein CheW [Lachnospiraceae bacterium]|nr:chemotaxis protein CheW [Lachnospiraceae bacterium]